MLFESFRGRAQNYQENPYFSEGEKLLIYLYSSECVTHTFCLVQK